MTKIAASDLLKQLLAEGAEFVAILEVTGDDREIPPDGRRAFPGDTLTLRFDSTSVRDAEVIEHEGVEYLEFWAAFYSTLRGERFFTLPVDRLVGIADVRNIPASAALSTRAESDSSPEAEASGESAPEPVRSKAERAGFRVIRGGG